MRAYFDWNATTPLLPAALEAMNRAARSAWANPSSVHADGRAARARVEEAREAIAALGEADPRDVVLTSGGTEANNLALRSAFHTGNGGPPSRLLLSRLEHPSVTHVAEALEREGRARVRWVRVSPGGIVDLDDLEHAMREGSARLVAVQAVNHETGVLQPTGEVARLAREHGALLHIDAVQAWGKLAPNASDGDTRTFAAHKVRGPKGIGALLSRPSARIEPVLLGGSQERGVRPGTLDPIGCAGVAVAARAAKPEHYAGVATLRDELEGDIVRLRPRTRVNGAGPRAPQVTNLAFEGISGAELVAALDLEGVSVSSGSACSAGTNEPSPVLAAMHDLRRAAESVRISLGPETTQAEVQFAVEVFRRVLARF